MLATSALGRSGVGVAHLPTARFADCGRRAVWGTAVIAAAGLTIGVTALAWLAPALLWRISLATRDPAVAISYWVAALAASVGAFAVAAGLMLVPGAGPTGAIGECWVAVRHGQLPHVDEVLGAAGLAALLAFTVRFLLQLVRRERSSRRAHDAHLALLHITGGGGSADVLWLEHATSVAYSLAGRPGLVVASAGLRHLPAEQLGALLCHERAHLRGRHHLLTAGARALAAAAPAIPLFRQASVAIALLVELAADTAAAREWGPHAVHDALLAVDRAGPPEPALAMAHEAVQMRLDRLADTARPTPVPAGPLRRAIAGLAVAALPVLLGLGSVLVLGIVSCPTG